MQLISTWYGISDVQTEEMVNDSLNASLFCGLAIEDSVPDHSTLSRFRGELTSKKAYDRILKKGNYIYCDTKLIKKYGWLSLLFFMFITFYFLYNIFQISFYPFKFIIK